MKIFISIIFILLFLAFDNSFAQESTDTVFVTANKSEIKEIYAKEGRDKALKDISEGKVCIYSYGLTIRVSGAEKLESQIDSLAKVYGFEYKLGGCSIPPWSDGYYEEVMEYLEKRNGVGWKKRFDEEVKKLEDEFYNSESK
jgi:hypothetical protein